MSRTFSANAMWSKIVVSMVFYCLLHCFTLSSAAQVPMTQEEIDRHKRMLKERERRTERQYLAEKSVLREADDLHDYIRPRVLQRASSSDRELAEERAESMSWYYAKVGWTRDHFESLEAVGFDAFSFVRENKPASGVVLAELVIIGKVIGTEETLEPRDGYRSSIFVKVEDVIKGAPAADTITIRQLSGRMADGDKKYVQNIDLTPEINSRYIFLLSNILYQYYIVNPDPVAEDNIDESSALLAKDRYIRQYEDLLYTDDGDLYSRFYGRLPTESTLGMFEAIAALVAER